MSKKRTASKKALKAKPSPKATASRPAHKAKGKAKAKAMAPGRSGGAAKGPSKTSPSKTSPAKPTPAGKAKPAPARGAAAKKPKASKKAAKPDPKRRTPTKASAKPNPKSKPKSKPKPMANAKAIAPVIPITAPDPVANQTRASSKTPSRISAHELAIELARLASDDNCSDVVVLDVRGLSPISDFVIVASGSSDRQMRAVADHAEELGAKHGHHAFRASKDPRALWLLIDFSDVVIHIFEPNTRAHYDIEMMWGDAKRIPWERDASAARPAPRSRKALAPT